MPDDPTQDATSSVVADTIATTGDTPASTPVDTSADTQASAPTGETPASPAAPETPQDDRAALLAIVQDAVKPKADPENSGSEGEAAKPGEDPKTDTDPNAQAEPETDPTDDELKALAPRTRKRIEKLLKQRGEARAEAETLKPAAALWQQFDGYLKQNDLAAEDVNLLLGVGATLRRGDFKGFLEGVMPYVTAARQHLGLDVTPDLQAKVDAGEMTLEAATELSIARMTNSRLEAQAKQQTTEQQQAQQREAHQRTAASIKTAVETWESGVRSRDPDYAKKMATVNRVSQALIAQHGQPMTVEAAVELAQRAYDETNTMLKGMIPAPSPSRSTPKAIDTASNGNMRAQPGSLMEAATMALERYHARA